MQCLINRELVYDGSAKVAFLMINETEKFELYKKQEIAYMLNIQPETLSRIIKKFERKGLISYNKSSLEILDTEALKSIYE